MLRFFVYSSVCLLSALLCCSCRLDSSAAELILQAEASRGDMSFRIYSDCAEVGVMDSVQLIMQAEADESLAFVFPELKKAESSYLVVDFAGSTPLHLDGGRILYECRYTLEPMPVAELSIPALTAQFKRENELQELVTEAFSLKVHLPEEFFAKQDIDSESGLHLAESLHRPGQSRRWLLTVAGLLLVSLAVLGFWLLRRNKKVQAPVVLVPAHVKALQALQQLLDEALPEQQAFKPFYQRLSLILRVYIEERFQINAPELTSEEFLASLTKEDSPLAEKRPLLQEFMLHCDLVKFAEHQPGAQNARQSFDYCKSFIEQTAEVVP